MEADDELLLLLGEAASLEIRPQVVDPSQPATLATPLQSCTQQLSNTHYIIHTLSESERYKERGIATKFRYKHISIVSIMQQDRN